ncbi:uncharacterized protein LOC129307959 [Prosopis cineraria]|uniref:uncharacterized protein LOC129307959 n=1 Tax=Prosopis cineraria TaxID=364024 RepID=UPI00241071DC|nr:uncharacterized protein LOC129307959 [Prosopis cineraria]XP_054804888.1 uncharacterized protein LOC129307959 [Prosopis cineraria]
MPGPRKELEKYWESDEFKAKSEKNKKNRAANTGGCVHRGGRITFAEHRRRMEVELGRPCEYPEVFKKIQHDEEKGWVGKRAANTYNEFERLKECQESDASISDSALWLQVVGGKNKRGRVYGLGTQAGLLNSNGTQCANTSGEIALLKKQLEEQKKFYEDRFEKVVESLQVREEEFRAREQRREEEFRAREERMDQK